MAMTSLSEEPGESRIPSYDMEKLPFGAPVRNQRSGDRALQGPSPPSSTTLGNADYVRSRSPSGVAKAYPQGKIRRSIGIFRRLALFSSGPCSSVPPVTCRGSCL